MDQLFNNYADALTFALAYSTQQYAQSPTAKLMKSGRVGTGKGLVALDGAGQAGMILTALEELYARDKLQYLCIVARYAPRSRTCEHCECQAMAQEYKEAIVTLGDWAMSTFTGLSLRPIRQVVIMNYFGDKAIRLAQECDRLKVNRRTTYDQRAKILAALKDIDTEAHKFIGERLAWVGSEAPHAHP